MRPEHLFPVPPLSLPRPLPTVDPPPIWRLRGHPACRRAQAVRPDFHLTEDNADAVADLRRLDGPGHPERPASAVRPGRARPAGKPAAAAARWRPRPASPPQTLRATIEWSYQLLEPSEQRLFELLSVFSGAGFEAVETVAAELDRLTGTQLDVLDGLASLVNKSLVRWTAARADEPRVVMLETIREYAAERLDDRSELAAGARRAHAACFADFAGAGGPT